MSYWGHNNFLNRHCRLQATDAHSKQLKYRRTIEGCGESSRSCQRPRQLVCFSSVSLGSIVASSCFSPLAAFLRPLLFELASFLCLLRHRAQNAPCPGPAATRRLHSSTRHPMNTHCLWQQTLNRKYGLSLANCVYLWYKRLWQECETGEATFPWRPGPILLANTVTGDSSKRRMYKAGTPEQIYSITSIRCYLLHIYQKAGGISEIADPCYWPVGIRSCHVSQKLGFEQPRHGLWIQALRNHQNSQPLPELENGASLLPFLFLLSHFINASSHSHTHTTHTHPTARVYWKLTSITSLLLLPYLSFLCVFSSPSLLFFPLTFLYNILNPSFIS